MSTPIIDIFFALLRYSLGADATPPACHCEERSDVAIDAAPSAVIPGTSNVIPVTDPAATHLGTCSLVWLVPVGGGSPLTEPLTAEQWKAIFSLSKKQSLLGVIYSGVKRLPAQLQPPADLMQQWMQLARRIMASNTLMNATAARLTQIFEERGRKTVILKGQANALLYPDPYVRQAGDIDILVEGGRSSVLKLLNEMNLLDKDDVPTEIHVHLSSNVIPGSEPGSPRKGVPVEVHFAPTYCFSSFATTRLQQFLSDELAKDGGSLLTPQGFYAPSMTFALAMQLSHMHRHFFNEGLGVRQLVDYYELLTHSTAAERAQLSSRLKEFNLYHTAGAIMWLMQKLFALPREQMLCEPDETRGSQLLGTIIVGGNFGKYSGVDSLPVFWRWFTERSRLVRNARIDLLEALWHEFTYISAFVRYIPKRIKHRKLSVRKV